MKIVEVMGMNNSKYGGLEQFMESLVKLDSNNKYYIIYNSPIRIKEYEIQLQKFGVELIYQSVSGLYIISFAWNFFFLLLRIKPDVVHVHFDPAGYVALFISYILRIKKRIKTVHSGITNAKQVVITDKKDLSLKTILLFRLMYFLSTDILCVSRAIKRQLFEIWGFDKKVSVLYLGVGIKTFGLSPIEIRKKYNLPVDKMLIANIAFHDDVKGVDLLLRSFAILKQEQKNVALVQIGQFKERTEYYKKLSRSLDVDSDIYWLGVQNNVQEILSACNIYTQPSRSEGVPLAIMEASSVALPTVAYAVGGIPEVCIDSLTGKLIPPYDYNLFAQELLKIIGDNELRMKMGKAARKYMLENFEKTNSINKLLKIYQK